MSAYLIEARSIGGLSGSPVFVRETVIYDDATLTYAKGSKKEKGVAYLTGQFHFLGLIHGHWEIDPDDKNEDNPRILLGNSKGPARESRVGCSPAPPTAQLRHAARAAH